MKTKRRPRMAFLFPGSGTVYIGMGRELNEKVPDVRSYLDGLARELGYDLRQTMFEGPHEALYPSSPGPSTSLRVETISALSLAVVHAFEKRGFFPDAFAGRSLGEYTALMASGGITRTEGFRLLRCLADQAQKDWISIPGRVLTAYGLGPQDARRLSRSVSRRHGPCEIICLYRSRRIAVVGGAPQAVAEFDRQARNAGATRLIRSREMGATHTSLTSGLARRMAAELKATPIAKPNAPLWCNYDAKPALSEAVLRRRLAAQLDHPVLWEKIIAGLVAEGVRFFVEIAPGRMLTEFLVRLPDGVEVLPTDTPRRLRDALDRLQKAGFASR